MKKVEPRTLAGFMELLPSDQILFNEMLEKIRSSYELHGFLPLDTPIIESAEVLLAKAGGETDKLIYRFNKGDNDLALRFDQTVPLAKYVAKNYGQLTFPFRRYQIGKVYRGERQQKGRFREFYQCDIDIIGNEKLDIGHDAEIASTISSVFKKLDIGNFTINMNNRKVITGFLEELELQEISKDVITIIDKSYKIEKSEVQKLLEELNIKKDKLDKITEFIYSSEVGNSEDTLKKLKSNGVKNKTYLDGLFELEKVYSLAKVMGVEDCNIKVNTRIVRGLDYYTGTVYETFLNDYREIGSICGGGHYDNLAEYYTNKNLPGVGISIGLTRLFYILNEMNLIKSDRTSISKVLVMGISQNEDEKKCFELANELRKIGINTETYVETTSLKTKLNYANKLKIPYVIIIGDEEVDKQKYAFKNMETGEQEDLNLDEIKSKLMK